jgi:uncharacterized protein (UPF0332 family)
MYDDLLKQGRIKQYKARPAEIQQLFKVSSRDIAASERNLRADPDWAYSMAYNAALQAGRALMLHEGYRPRGSEGHATVVEFVREKLGAAYTDQVNLFDQMRRKRHRVIYEVAGLISKREAEQALLFVKEFVEKIGEIISGQRGLGV